MSVSFVKILLRVSVSVLASSCVTTQREHPALVLAACHTPFPISSLCVSSLMECCGEFL